MSRARVLQEIRTMRFEEVFDWWTEKRLSQQEAAALLGVCERQFRRQCRRYESDGLEGLIDLRLGQVSARRAPVDEVLRLVEQYRGRYAGWTVKHFYSKYQEQKGPRSYNFVRLALQRQGVVAKAKRRGAHRRRRERKPLIGMMLHQDGSRYAWLVRQQHDLIVSLDDATGAIYSAFLVAEEGTMSSLAGVAEVIAAPRAVQQSVYRSWQSLLAHPESRWQGGSGQPHPVRAGNGSARDRDDSGLFPGSPRALRARVPHSPSAPTQRTGRRHDHRPGRGQPVPQAPFHPGL